MRVIPHRCSNIFEETYTHACHDTERQRKREYSAQLHIIVNITSCTHSCFAQFYEFRVGASKWIYASEMLKSARTCGTSLKERKSFCEHCFFLRWVFWSQCNSFENIWFSFSNGLLFGCALHIFIWASSNRLIKQYHNASYRVLKTIFECDEIWSSERTHMLWALKLFSKYS